MRPDRGLAVPVRFLSWRTGRWSRRAKRVGHRCATFGLCLGSAATRRRVGQGGGIWQGTETIGGRGRKAAAAELDGPVKREVNGAEGLAPAQSHATLNPPSTHLKNVLVLRCACPL